jgi:hypothetical protein
MIIIEDIYGIDNTDLYTFHDSIRVQKGEYDYYYREIDYPESDSISWSNLSLLRTVLSINNTRVLNGLEMVKDQLKEVDVFLIPKYMSYGDYDDSCMVERSNYKIFLEDYKEECGIFRIYGGYGSSGIAISIRYLLDPVNEDKADEIIELLNGLNNYPVIDDNDMSNMEYKLFLESLDSYAIKDCSSLLAKQFLLDVYDFNEDMLKEILLESDRNLNYPSYQIESGGSCYIDNERLIEKVTLTQYITCLIGFELKGDL